MKRITSPWIAGLVVFSALGILIALSFAISQVIVAATGAREASAKTIDVLPLEKTRDACVCSTADAEVWKAKAYRWKKIAKKRSAKIKVLRKKIDDLRRPWSTVRASWYGPGLYGNSVACPGYGRLTRSTQGVAHKSMKCGTKVDIKYRGKTVTVRVIDRGPYIHGRTFDLTGATAKDLGFDGVHSIEYRVSK